jgi:hypothetical protein
MNKPEPVSLTVHTANAPDLADTAQAQQRRTRHGRVKMLLVLLVCAAPVMASYLTYFFIRPAGRSNYGELIQPTRSLPALRLQGPNGQPVNPAGLRGQWLLVTVGPSACTADCEKRLFVQRQLREMLGRERARIEKIWFVTDPGKPPPALTDTVQGVPPPTLLVVDRAALALWLVPATGQALEDHLYVVDPMGEWMMRLPAQVDPARAKRDLERLLRASAFWDPAGR